MKRITIGVQRAGLRYSLLISLVAQMAATALIRIVKHFESSTQGCYFSEKPLPTNA